MARKTPQVAYVDYEAVRRLWWPNFYSSFHSVPPVIYPHHEYVLRLVDAAYFQAELRGSLYVIDEVSVLVENQMEVVPYALVFACTLNTFLKSQGKNETKSQHRCNKEEHVNQE